MRCNDLLRFAATDWDFPDRRANIAEALLEEDELPVRTKTRMNFAIAIG